MISKSACQKKHAKNRARERFQIIFNNQQLKDIVQKIQKNQLKFIERQSNRITIWELSLPDNKSCCVVYDKMRKTIVTFLPRDWKDIPEVETDEQAEVKEPKTWDEFKQII